ncbi:unnamed protein product [Chironomus riparius]|uniref:tRNA-intron lyase n=1 Tax=Chironomus riparius TaxID=315576 RepID=A0A9N9WMP6_9DIPT|nr:unnamed protein product [Chironomus riparius]
MIRKSSNDSGLIPAPKRRRHKNFDVKPFPTDCKLIATFTGLDVEIFDPKSIKILGQCGNYGNNALNYRHRQLFDEEKIPIVSQNDYQRKLRWKKKYLDDKSSPIEKLIKVEEVTVQDPFPISQSHVLIIEEAMFLQKELNCLEIMDIGGNLMTTEDLWNEFCDLKHNFVECYVGYLYLKSKNWVIKSGIKFGGHFMTYKHGPQYYHASYIVKIVTSPRTCNEHQTNERIAEVTKKTMLYLEVYHPEDIDSTKYLDNLDKFKVKEVVIQRYDVKERFMS